MPGMAVVSQSSDSSVKASQSSDSSVKASQSSDSSVKASQSSDSSVKASRQKNTSCGVGSEHVSYKIIAAVSTTILHCWAHFLNVLPESPCPYPPPLPPLLMPTTMSSTIQHILHVYRVLQCVMVHDEGSSEFRLSTCTAVSLHIHCTYTACTLYEHWMIYMYMCSKNCLRPHLKVPSKCGRCVQVVSLSRVI